MTVLAETAPVGALDRIAPTGRPVNVPVVMRQTWADLLFLHWPVAADDIQRLLPPGLTVDTFDGQAYVGLVPFTMRGIRPVWSPPVPGLSAFHEVNVRTYVHREGRDPGVWFFSLDAANAVAVATARRLWGLPYYRARMSLRRSGMGQIEYVSRRVRKADAIPADCRVRYEAMGTPAAAPVGSSEFFFAERYFLYVYRNGGLWRGQVHHRPYPLQAARIESLEESLIAAAGIALPGTAPLAHYACRVDVEIFPLQRVP